MSTPRPTNEELLSRARSILVDRGFILDRPVLPEVKTYANTTDRPQGHKALYVVRFGARPRVRMKWFYRSAPDDWVVVPLCDAGPLSPEQEASYRAELARAQATRAKEAEAAAEQAREKLRRWCVPADGSEDYLRDKGLPAVPGLQTMRHGGSLVVPARNARDEVRFLQYIWLDRTAGRFLKVFSKDCAKAGCFFEIEGDGSVVFVCEGIADGISVHLATGCRVIVAFDCDNLLPVATSLVDAGRLDGSRAVFVCDNDWAHKPRSDGKPDNPGIRHGIEAARAVGGLICVPVRDREKAPSGLLLKDADDVRRKLGLDVLAERLREVETPPEPRPDEKPLPRDPDMFPDPDLSTMPSYMMDDLGLLDLAPEPQPLREDASEQAPYPADAFGSLAGAVGVMADRCCVHPSVAGGVVLGYLSLLCQRIWNVRSRRHTTPSSLFMLMVLASGEGKSDVERIAGKVIRECEADLRAVYKEEHRRWVIAMKVHAKALAKLDRDFAKDSLSEDEYRQRLEDMDGREPQEPLGPELTISDLNQEGLYRQLRDGRASAAVFAAEGGKLFGGLGFSDENKLKFVASCSDLWSGDPLDKLRQGEGSSKLVDRRLSMCLMVQPVVAEALFKDALLVQQGYLARFLPTAPAPMRKRFVDEDVSALPEMQAYYEACRNLLAKKPLDMDRPGEGLALEDMRLDGPALDAYMAYVDEIEDDLDPEGGARRYEPVREIARRSAEQATRIAAVLTGAWSPYSQEVLPEAMESGVRLARWYLEEALRMKSDSDASPVVRHAEAIMRWLSGQNPTRMPLASTSMKQLRVHGPRPRNAEDVQKAVELLVKTRWLRPAGPGEVWMGNGRTVTARQTYRVAAGYGRHD